MSNARRGIAIPLVVLAIMVFMIFAGTLLFTSKGEYRLVKKTEDRERARYIAESAIAIASSLIFQNNFEDRWYRKTIGKYGYTHVIEGAFAGGTYRVRAEDVMNELTPEMKADNEKRILELRYKRVDLFARGAFGNEAVILHQALSLQPEEKVYGYTTTVLTSNDGMTQPLYSGIHVR